MLRNQPPPHTTPPVGTLKLRTSRDLLTSLATLTAVAVILAANRSSACFVNDCPEGGKRSAPAYPRSVDQLLVGGGRAVLSPVQSLEQWPEEGKRAVLSPVQNLEQWFDWTPMSNKRTIFSPIQWPDEGEEISIQNKRSELDDSRRAVVSMARRLNRMLDKIRPAIGTRSTERRPISSYKFLGGKDGVRALDGTENPFVGMPLDTLLKALCDALLGSKGGLGSSHLGGAALLMGREAPGDYAHPGGGVQEPDPATELRPSRPSSHPPASGNSFNGSLMPGNSRLFHELLLKMLPRARANKYRANWDRDNWDQAYRDRPDRDRADRNRADWDRDDRDRDIWDQTERNIWDQADRDTANRDDWNQTDPDETYRDRPTLD